MERDSVQNIKIEHSKTEYVLAGTFLSFGIALLCGLMATK